MDALTRFAQGKKGSLPLPASDGDYDLTAGIIDTTGLAPGHYVLKLVPPESVVVLRSDVDLSVPINGNVVTYADSVSEPVQVEFDVAAP